MISKDATAICNCLKSLTREVHLLQEEIADRNKKILDVNKLFSGIENVNNDGVVDCGNNIREQKINSATE